MKTIDNRPQTIENFLWSIVWYLRSSLFYLGLTKVSKWCILFFVENSRSTKERVMCNTTPYTQTEEYNNDCIELTNLRNAMYGLDLYQFFYIFAVFIFGLYLLLLPAVIASTSIKYGKFYPLLFLFVYPLYKLLSWPMRIWRSREDTYRKQAISIIEKMAKGSPWVARCHGYTFNYELPQQPGER